VACTSCTRGLNDVAVALGRNVSEVSIIRMFSCNDMLHETFSDNDCCIIIVIIIIIITQIDRGLTRS